MTAPKRTRRAGPRTPADVRARALVDVLRLAQDLAGGDGRARVTIYHAAPELLEAAAALAGSREWVATGSKGNRWRVVDVGALSLHGDDLPVEAAS